MTTSDPFAFTQQVYEEQRKAFVRAQLQRHRSPPRRALKPELLPLSLVDELPFDFPTSYKSLSLHNRGALILRRLGKLPSFKRQPGEYYRRVDMVLNSCKAVERLPNIRRRVRKEKTLLKRYSAHMDWTLNTLKANADVEYRVLRPLMTYLAEERLVTEPPDTQRSL